MLISLRIQDEFVAEIDGLAKSDGRSRNAFLVRTLKGALHGTLDKQGIGDAAPGHSNGRPSGAKAADGSGLVERNATRSVQPVSDAQLHNAPKPSIEALRAICRGDSKPAGIAPDVVEIPMCLKTWWEDGEQYECLMDKGHKIAKCGQRGMVRNITP